MVKNHKTYRHSCKCKCITKKVYS